MAQTPLPKPKCPTCVKVVLRTVSYRNGAGAVFLAQPCGHTLTMPQYSTMMKE